ncbi:SDR family oxidoreductase [Allopusillimonas ginsengisoli]|nr:SDR family oxidoreductase [Allopusillimonas ginsengisoli]
MTDKHYYGRLKGRVALVFGGGSSEPGWSNGKAAAVLYAREGATVAVVDIDLDAARETCRILQEEGLSGLALQADVTCESQVAEAVNKTLVRYGQIDVLHNNVGITRMGLLPDLELADWQKVIDTNLTSVFLTCKHVIPSMLERGGGSIVNISSLASIQINNYPYAPYFASKAGLNQLTRALAVQYAADNIRVNAVLPGVINTPLVYRQISGQFENQEAMIAARNAASPMGRMGEAWDVAYAALFLASDESRYITGVCIPVDGGKSCAGR